MELLRLAAWRAGRSGLDELLLHPVSMRPEPAEDVVRALLEHVGDALEDTGGRSSQGVARSERALQVRMFVNRSGGLVR